MAAEIEQLEKVKQLWFESRTDEPGGLSWNASEYAGLAAKVANPMVAAASTIRPRSLVRRKITVEKSTKAPNAYA